MATKSVRKDYYRSGDVDFDDLAKHDGDWARISKRAKAEGKIDFQDPDVVLQLTRSLLRADFHLTLDLPPNRLCPPVPVRWNYIRWIQELLDTTADTYIERYDPGREVCGLDIGTGASAIYPLLACRSREGWRMVGSDVDAHSLAYARENVEANELGKRIKLSRSERMEDALIPMERLGIEELDFCMTNPPFYSSREDMEASYTGKSAAPSAVCTGSANEMICPEGDVGFVNRIVDESLVLRERVQWYTAMLGKLSSLQTVVERLKREGVGNWAVVCLQAGKKTRRWAVGWSFQAWRPRNDIARCGELVRAVLPPATEQTVEVVGVDQKGLGKRVDEVMKGLDVRWIWKELLSAGVMECKGNVWSRAARRKKRFADEVDNMAKGSEEDEEDEVALAVKISCHDGKVEVRWLRGLDQVLFESFCGMLKRALLAPG